MYRHAAILYQDENAFLAGTVPFVRAGMDADEPTLVVLPEHRIEPLRDALGDTPESVQFADMQEVGSNPAHIIPVWRRFVDEHPGRKVRGIGEPISAERGEAELRECQHHERLLNPALRDSDLYLLCPYDTTALSAEVIDEARRSHPLLVDGERERRSAEFLGSEADTGMLHEPLGPPPDRAASLRDIDVDDLAAARAFVDAEAARGALPADRRMDLVLAVNELVTNSLLHGGSAASVSVWRQPDAVVAEVQGGGHIDDALVDRTEPPRTHPDSRGLWLANQVCDLVQLRSLATGVVARLFVRPHPPWAAD